jgi:hypothetical protein
MYVNEDDVRFCLQNCDENDSKCFEDAL